MIAYLQDVLAASVMGFGHKAHGSGLIRTGSTLPPPMFLGNSGSSEPLCAHPGEGFARLVSEHEVRCWLPCRALVTKQAVAVCAAVWPPRSSMRCMHAGLGLG